MKAPHSSTSSFEQRARRALAGCCWAVVIVAAVDLLCRATLPSGAQLEIEDLMRARVESMPAPDIEVVGDSVARSGFVASALGNDALSTGNVSTPASGAPKSYLLLARQFATGRVPKVLVIAHSPHTFGQVRYEVLVGGFAHWTEIPGLALDAERWTDVVYGVLTRFSYILMHRDSFRALLTDADASFFKDWSRAKPAVPDADRLQKVYRDLEDGTFKPGAPAAIGFSADGPFSVKPMNDRYFRRLLDLAKAHGVKVFWVTMPTTPDAVAARAKVRYQEDMLAYLRQFEADGRLHILQGPFKAYPDTMFRDWLHLNEVGAMRFACELEKIKAPVVAAALANGAGTGAQSTTAPGDRFASQLAPLCARELPYIAAE